MRKRPTPKGPRGEKRPADAIGLAVMIGKIATGEIENPRDEKLSSAAAQLGSRGGRARADSMSPTQRRAIAIKAAKTRWAKSAAPAPEGVSEPQGQ